MLKRIANAIGRRAKFRKRLPKRFGHRRIMVTPNAYMRYWTHSLEAIHSELLGWVDELVRSGDCVWDIGANVGVLTFAAAVRAGREGSVVAVEADLKMVELLRCSARNGQQEEAPIEVLPAAVADRVGLARFAKSSFRSATNALEGFGRFAGVSHIEQVCMITLDFLLEHVRRPNVVKIDVEGAEALVLRGASKLLSDVRPLLVIEVGNEASRTVTELLQTNSYDAYDGRLLPSKRIKLVEAAGDVIAVPRERAVPWRQVTVE